WLGFLARCGCRRFVALGGRLGAGVEHPPHFIRWWAQLDGAYVSTLVPHDAVAVAHVAAATVVDACNELSVAGVVRVQVHEFKGGLLLVPGSLLECVDSDNLLHESGYVSDGAPILGVDHE